MRFRSSILALLISSSIASPLRPQIQQAPNLSVRILDQQTNSPIPDAIVTAGGTPLAAASDGSFALSPNITTVAARAPGFRATTARVSDLRDHHGELTITPFAVHALYLTEYGIASKSLREPALDLIRRGGANALVVNIKSDRGMIVYPSSIPLATQAGARKLTTIHSLAALVAGMHARGVYMIARVVTFKDNPLATARPDLAVHLANGALFKDREHLSWTDPFRPEVRAYNIGVGLEAAQAGFDEVQFDYVRFPDSATKLKFAGPTDEASRVKAITEFLAEAHRALAPYNVFESVDVFGYIAWNTNDTGIGQHIEEITRTVDYVCPMLYPSGFQFGIPGHPRPVDTDQDIYSIVNLSLDEALRRTHADSRKFRPWLQAFRDYAFNHRPFGPTEVAAQIRAATDAHTSGWSLWNPRNQYQDTGLVQDADTSLSPSRLLPRADEHRSVFAAARRVRHTHLIALVRIIRPAAVDPHP